MDKNESTKENKTINIYESEKQDDIIVNLQNQGYYLKRKINLKKDTKRVTAINFLCFVLMISSAFVGLLFIFDIFNKSQLAELIKWQNFLVIGIGLLLYLFIHELLHALFIKVFNKDGKINFGFNGIISYVGAEGSFNKLQYIIVSLAPFIILSTFFILSLLLLPMRVFLGFYCLICLNIGASAGDFYMVGWVLFKPSNIKIFSNGLEILIYYKKKS